LANEIADKYNISKEYVLVEILKQNPSIKDIFQKIDINYFSLELTVSESTELEKKRIDSTKINMQKYLDKSQDKNK
jgi:hypothetical protein